MDLNIHFWRKDKEMTNKHKKIAQHHWFFREMQFKTRMRFDHTIVRMATIKNQMIKSYYGWENEGSIYTGESLNSLSFTKLYEVSSKIKNKSTIWSSNPNNGYT